MVYINALNNSNNWVQFDIKTQPGGTWAFDHTVKIYAHDSSQLQGMDDVRTDVSYRSKRYPILHFGLGNTDSIDVVVSKGNSVYHVNGLPANHLHQLYLSEITGIDELYKSNSIKIHPNPSNSHIYVDCQSGFYDL